MTVTECPHSYTVNRLLLLCETSLGHQKIPEGNRKIKPSFRPILSGADIDVYIIHVGLHREACPRTALDGERESVATKEDGGR